MEFTTRAFSPWHAIVKVYEDNCQGVAQVGGDTDYRVTVERIEPEPEKKWWECQWHWYSGFQTRRVERPGGFDSNFTKSGIVTNVVGRISSATEPTLSEFADAVKAATGVEITMPEEEEPQWWYRVRGGKWITPTTTDGAEVDNTRVCVFGTTKDRDAKAAVLIDAARKAGKPD